MRFFASRSKSASKGKKSGKSSAPIRRSMLTNDQWLDLLGYGLLAASAITLLSWLSNQRGDLTGSWITLLGQLFGWGAIVAPVLMGGLGLYLVVRRFGDRVPRPHVSRVIGVFLLYFTLLGLFNFIGVATQSSPDAMISNGQGGGAVGFLIANVLTSLLGNVGAVLVLFLSLLVSVMLIAATSFSQILDVARDQFAKLRAPKPKSSGNVIVPSYDPSAPPDDVPINGLKRAPTASTASSPAAAPVVAASLITRPTDGKMPTPRVIGQPDPAPAAQPASSASAQPAANPPAPPPAQPAFNSRYSGKQDWLLPKTDQMLESGTDAALKEEDMRERARTIEETLKLFGVPARVVEINCGPTITQYGMEPGFIEMKNGKQQKVKVSRIAGLADDLALALSAPRIRIEAPIPGKGLVGIEVPNGATSIVSLRDVMETEPFARVQLKSRLPLALGQDVSGGPVVADLTAMPHLLIAGTTGSGKSVCVNGIITTLLMLNSPSDLRLIMIDPKRVELTGYNGLPHLLSPVVVEVEKVTQVLHWVSREMDNRYRTFAKYGARNITDFNAKAEEAEAKRKQNEARQQADPSLVVQQAGDDDLRKLPYIVVVIDELADLMMLAPDETEKTICRLAQMARATGIHLIIATQRPSVDVVTGLIKANFPARIAFTVATSIDSRVILDQPGAEKLLGRGDMLFVAPDASAPLRSQGCFLGDKEINKVVRHWRAQAGTQTSDDFAPAAASLLAGAGLSGPMVGTLNGEATPMAAPSANPNQLTWDEARMLDQAMKDTAGGGKADNMYDQAVETVRLQGKASISLLQRRLRIGYTRAARLIEEMEEKGVVGPQTAGSQFREVLPPRHDVG